MPAGRRTRILIVDDSAVMRSLLRSVVCADPSFEVAGTAADGASALAGIGLLRPDLILLDVEMPVMDGLVTLKKLRAQGHKMPVIMCSSVTRRGARVTLDALAAGASDYVAKPFGQSDRESAKQALAQELRPKIHALTSAAPAQPEAMAKGLPFAAFPGIVRAPFLAPPVSPIGSQPITAQPTVLAIGVSTGGPAALEVLLPELPVNFPLPVMVVQHMPELFTKLFAERLDSRCPLRVCEAAEGETVRRGTIYIARGDWHMEVLAGARAGLPPTLHQTQGPLENHCRPAVDVLFRSAAAVYGSGVLAAVLTGMGSDGMLGARVIRERGGSILAQDQASSVVWGMPGAVVNAGLADRVLPLAAMAAEILRLAGRINNEARELWEQVV